MFIEHLLGFSSYEVPSSSTNIFLHNSKDTLERNNLVVWEQNIFKRDI